MYQPLRPTQPSALIGMGNWVMSTGQEPVAVIFVWEGNRGFGIVRPCVTVAVVGYSHLQAQ